MGGGVIEGYGLTAACSVLCFTDKLTSASKDSLSTLTSPSQSPNSVHGSRRGSISSMSSVSSVLDEKDDDRIRCCTHCKDTLLKREQQIDEKEHTPDIVKLYEVTPYMQSLVSFERQIWLFITYIPAHFGNCFGKLFFLNIFSFC